MSDEQKTTDTPIQVAVLDIPEERMGEVLAYIEGLKSQDAEVAGYVAAGRPMTMAAGGSMSGTGCALTGGKLNPSDFNCTDSDRA